MKIISKILRILAFSLLFAAGLFCLLEFVSYDRLQTVSSYLKGIKDHKAMKTVLGAFGFFLLFLPFVMLYLWNRRRLKTCRYTVPATAEPLSLRLSAIESFAVQEAEEHRLVDRASAVVRKWGKAVVVRLIVELHPDENVLIICEEVRNRVRGSLENVLGIPEVRRISIQVGRVLGSQWV